MILNFDEFQKGNQSGSELNNIRIKNLNIFKKKGFPSKREENWKYTDLKTILSNNLNSQKSQIIKKLLNIIKGGYSKIFSTIK